MGVDKYEIKRCLYNSEVPKEFRRHFYKYYTKCLKLKVPARGWPYSVFNRNKFCIRGFFLKRAKPITSRSIYLYKNLECLICEQFPTCFLFLFAKFLHLK